MRIVSKLALVLLILLLAACGGDAGFVANDKPDPGTDPVDPGDPGAAVASISLLSSSPQLATGDDNGVTITAIVRDAGNLVIEGKTVIFRADSGSLQVVNATTNAEGIAMATLKTGGDESNRTITVSALSGDVTSTIGVDAAGTAITVSGQNSMVLTATNTLTLTLKDSFGVGINDEDLTITSTQSPTVTEVDNVTNTGTGSLTVTTNASGQAQVVLKPNNSGTHTVTVESLGARKTYVIAVSNDVFELAMPDSATREVNLGAYATVQITYEDNGGPRPNQTVNFVTTRGGFGTGRTRSTTVTTNANGIASVSISSLNAGPVTIQAYVNGGPSASLMAEFVATTTNTLELQTDYSSVSLGGGEATIVATVRDASNNLVKNKRVNFSLDDVTGGSLSVASDTTNSNGQASTVYKSSATASAKDGVIISAEVDENANANDTVALTVGNAAAFVTLGSGNQMEEPDSTNYRKPFTVRVADAAGAGVPNVEVSLALIPLKYYKGYYEWDKDSKFWVARYTVDTTSECLNEDRNHNTVFDSGDVDDNGDGELWPGIPATLSKRVVTTNEVGEAQFTVNYSQQYANFVQVSLEASAKVSGTEAKNRSKFVLPGIASDFNVETNSPPGLEQATMLPSIVADDNDDGESDRVLAFAAGMMVGSPYGIGNAYSYPQGNTCEVNELHEYEDFQLEFNTPQPYIFP